MHWRELAACKAADPEEESMFFGDRDDLAAQTQHRIVRKKFCYNCDVQIECLMYAYDNDLRFGVWGGLTESHRRRRLREAIKRDGASVDVFIRTIEMLRPR